MSTMILKEYTNLFAPLSFLALFYLNISLNVVQLQDMVQLFLMRRMQSLILQLKLWEKKLVTMLSNI